MSGALGCGAQESTTTRAGGLAAVPKKGLQATASSLRWGGTPTRRDLRLVHARARGSRPGRRQDCARSASGVRVGVCAQTVPNSSALERIPAHSSARRHRALLFREQAVTHTYANCGLGLKILVSAVQSRPSPPFFSATCPSENFPRSELVPRFVPNSGTLQRIPAHSTFPTRRFLRVWCACTPPT
jgi:hypothetical protein